MQLPEPLRNQTYFLSLRTAHVENLSDEFMWLVIHGDKYGARAWKSFDWGTLDRLYEKGYIFDPKSKAKSVALTDEAVKLSESFFIKHFVPKPGKR